MKLKKVSKEVTTEKEKAERSRRGRRSRTKGANYERTIAKKLKEFFGIDFARTPQSGGFAKKAEKASNFRGDIVSIDKDYDISMHMELKNHNAWSLPAWIKQAEEDCPEGKLPCVIMHKPNTSIDYITMRLEDFLALCDNEKVLIRNEGEKIV